MLNQIKDKRFEAPVLPGQVRFCKDEPIYLQGDQAPAWFAVVEGVVRTCVYDADGNRQVTGFMSSGDVFGLNEHERVDCAEAVTSVCVWRVERPLGGLTPGQAEVFCKVMAKGLVNAQQAIALFGRRSINERLAAFLLVMADRFGTGDQFNFPMPRSDIADYLGTNIFSISRAFTDLSRSGLIELRSAQICRVLNRVGLQDLSGRTG